MMFDVGLGAKTMRATPLYVVMGQLSGLLISFRFKHIALSGYVSL